MRDELPQLKTQLYIADYLNYILGAKQCQIFNGFICVELETEPMYFDADPY